MGAPMRPTASSAPQQMPFIDNDDSPMPPDVLTAAAVLSGLAGMLAPGDFLLRRPQPEADAADVRQPVSLDLDAIYRTLVEQIPAVVFMANLERGVGDAYVSPQIEASL